MLNCYIARLESVAGFSLLVKGVNFLQGHSGTREASLSTAELATSNAYTHTHHRGQPNW